jgi:hypothetical protein
MDHQDDGERQAKGGAREADEQDHTEEALLEKRKINTINEKK